MPKPTLESIYMRFAYMLSDRSRDTKLKVGCVITDSSLQYVLGIGYNGGAAGQSDIRESPTPGESQLIHAEINALIKCNNMIQDKVVFLTHAPCRLCAKALVNSKIKNLYYSEVYRDDGGLVILKNAGIIVNIESIERISSGS